MDRPQFQIPTSNVSYRFMAYPPKRSQLHELYPGEPMKPYYHFTGENIPHENPIQAQKTNDVLYGLTKIADSQSENISRRLGGHSQVNNLATIEPEQPIEDLDGYSGKSSIGTRNNTVEPFGYDEYGKSNNSDRSNRSKKQIKTIPNKSILGIGAVCVGLFLIVGLSE